MRYVAERIPTHYSGRSTQPHEVAKYKKKNIPEAEKIYFCGWKFIQAKTDRQETLKKHGNGLVKKRIFFVRNMMSARAGLTKLVGEKIIIHRRIV